MIGQRLAEVRKFYGHTQKAMAEELLLTHSTYNRYESNTIEPNMQFLHEYCNNCNVNINWLLTGKGEMFLTDRALEVISDPDAFINVEVIESISAGEPLHINNGEPVDYIPIHKSLLRYPYKYYCFPVNGTSMAPEIEHGDYVIIEERHDFADLDGQVIAVNSDDGLTLKRLILDHKNKCSYLLPGNKVFTPILMNETHKILGVLKLIIRRY